MSPSSTLRLVTTNELSALYPTILPRSTLDFYAQHCPEAIPFSQPFGKGGRRVYNLDIVEQILAGGFQPLPSENIKKPKAPPIKPKNAKSRRKVGIGLAAYSPKKRGPKSANHDGGE